MFSWIKKFEKENLLYIFVIYLQQSKQTPTPTIICVLKSKTKKITDIFFSYLSYHNYTNSNRHFFLEFNIFLKLLTFCLCLLVTWIPGTTKASTSILYYKFNIFQKKSHVLSVHFSYRSNTNSNKYSFLEIKNLKNKFYCIFLWFKLCYM